MKCPACGFETPKEQGYCDFCKEPFRREAKPAVSGEPAKEVPKEVLLKLSQLRVAAAEEKAAKADIPPEFAGLDTGGEIPTISPAVRRLAWGFFGIVVLWMVTVTVLAVWKGRQVVRRPAVAAGPAEPRIP